MHSKSSDYSLSIHFFCYIYLLIHSYSRLFISFDTANAVITCMSLFFTLLSSTPWCFPLLISCSKYYLNLGSHLTAIIAACVSKYLGILLAILLTLATLCTLVPDSCANAATPPICGYLLCIASKVFKVVCVSDKGRGINKGYPPDRGNAVVGCLEFLILFDKFLHFLMVAFICWISLAALSIMNFTSPNSFLKSSVTFLRTAIAFYLVYAALTRWQIRSYGFEAHLGFLSYSLPG